jgi:hypothetical protein
MLHDLNISLDGLDTDALLHEWRWVVPADFRPVQLSKFGNWFFVAPDGSVYLLDLIDGELRQIAVSIHDFDKLKDFDDNRAEWYLDSFVLQCESQGMVIEQGECFGWRLHPMLGGSFEMQNVQKFALTEYQSLVAKLVRQRREIPRA